MQDTLGLLREEILSTTKLPLAIDFLGSELRHTGRFSTAMARLAHYFTPFQTYVVSEAENDEGRFDLLVGLEVLQREAAYRAKGATAASLFLYEFEVLCRNRLSYERGLDAVAGDPIFDDDWRQWISTVRRQIGIVEFADLLYVRSESYRQRRSRCCSGIVRGESPGPAGRRTRCCCFPRCIASLAIRPSRGRNGPTNRYRYCHSCCVG